MENLIMYIAEKHCRFSKPISQAPMLGSTEIPHAQPFLHSGKDMLF